jgi:hypothetical protein
MFGHWPLTIIVYGSVPSYRVIYIYIYMMLGVKLMQSRQVNKREEWDWLPSRFESLVNIQIKLSMIKKEVVIFLYIGLASKSNKYRNFGSNKGKPTKG